MTISAMARHFTMFVVILATMLVNGDDNMLARIGMGNDLIASLSATVLIVILLIGRSLVLAGVVAALCLTANMPADFGLNFGFDRDYITGLTFAMAAAPHISKLME